MIGNDEFSNLKHKSNLFSMKSHLINSIHFKWSLNRRGSSMPSRRFEIEGNSSSKTAQPHLITSLITVLRQLMIFFNRLRIAIATSSVSLVKDSYVFLRNYKQNQFTANAGDYEKRKLEILFQLNRLQLLLGVIMPVIVFFNENYLPFLSALLFLLPPLINVLVLKMASKQKSIEAMIAYLVLYPFFTNLAYADSFSQGADLFIVLYGILSVFFLQQLSHIAICVGFSMLNYFLVVVLLSRFNDPSSEISFQIFFVLNHIVAIAAILYSLWLLKKENTGHQASMLATNNELTEMNVKVSRQNNEIAEKAKQLEQQAARLNEMDNFKNTLFSIVSHDLKTPLYALRNLFQEVEKQDLPADEVREMVPDVLKDLNYATELTENLLSWAKSQMTGGTVSPHDIKVSPMIIDIVQLIRLQAEQKDIKIDCQLKEKLSIYADSDMIRLVLRNLLSNAIKFTPRGGTVSIITDATDNDVEIIIKDTGEGMDDVMLEKIRSNNYFTTEGTSGERGTGLGLMLCREFLGKNKGMLHIESAKGEGSIFSFTLPAA